MIKIADGLVGIVFKIHIKFTLNTIGADEGVIKAVIEHSLVELPAEVVGVVTVWVIGEKAVTQNITIPIEKVASDMHLAKESGVVARCFQDVTQSIVGIVSAVAESVNTAIGKRSVRIQHFDRLAIHGIA